MDKIGFGGSCHWCTEAIFQSLKGVLSVQQGWIAGDNSDSAFSEAVIVEFDPAMISLDILILVHLHTHSCTAEHSLRSKYRSAVYVYGEKQAILVKQVIEKIQPEFDAPIITRIIPLIAFKLNQEQYLNYYYNDPEKPFCQNIVQPKLKLLLEQFANVVDTGKLKG